MNAAFSTSCEKMGLDVHGSDEDARHRTTPETKNLMSAGHLTRKAERRSRNKEQAISRAGTSSWLRPLLFVEGHLVSLGLNFLICKVDQQCVP